MRVRVYEGDCDGGHDKNVRKVSKRRDGKGVLGCFPAHEEMAARERSSSRASVYELGQPSVHLLQAKVSPIGQRTALHNAEAFICV